MGFDTLSMGLSVLKNPISSKNWLLGNGHYENSIPFPAIAYSDQTAADTIAHVIFPRPNSETSAYSRQRWAHPSFDYQIPIAVRGGAFPYKMEIDVSKPGSYC